MVLGPSSNQVRCLTSLSTKVESGKDEFTLDNFYNWFSGFTDAEGQIVIKSSGKLKKKRPSIPQVPSGDQGYGFIIKDEYVNTLNEFKSIKSCAVYLGISHQTVVIRLRDEKSIKWDSKLIYVKPHKD